MAKRREQRAADKQRRRAARKGHDRRRAVRAKMSVQPVTRAADGILDEATYARVGYDPMRVPAAVEWLALDEGQRMGVAEAYHRLLPPAKQPPNAQLHASIHAIVETQLAEGDPPEVVQAMARLTAEGLDRHSAVHAIGSILSTYMLEVMKGAEAFDTAAYARDLSELTRESWLASLRS